jgi:hypothetical protein
MANGDDEKDKDKEGLPPGFVLKQDRWGDQPTTTPAAGRAAEATAPGVGERTWQAVKKELPSWETVKHLPVAAAKAMFGEGALFGGEGYGGAMAPRTVEEMLSPAELAAGEAIIPPIGERLGKLAGRAGGTLSRLGENWRRPPMSAEEVEGLAAGRPRPEPAAEGTIPAVRPAPEAPPAPPAPRPSADAQLNAIAQRIFKKPYGDLTNAEQRVVARNTGGAVPAERRQLVGQAPGVLERRAGAMPLPMNSPEAGITPFPERRVGGETGPRAQLVNPGQRDLYYSLQRQLSDPKLTPRDRTIIQAQIDDIVSHPFEHETLPPIQSMKAQAPMTREAAEAASAQRSQGRTARFGAPTATNVPAGPTTLPTTAIATPAEAVPGQAATQTLPRTAPPAAPAPTTLGGEPVPRASLDEILRQATGQGPRPKPDVPLSEQLRRGQSSVSEKPPPADPLKAEFPDPTIRRFARANGAELLRAAGDRPDVVQAVHDLTNVEVRQAAIEAGIDVGEKHVGSRQLLGEGQVSRQSLIDQMIQKGVKPEEIPRLAKPQPVPIENLKVGDTFVDEDGHPRRIVEITKDGKIKTADGTLRTYKGEIKARGELNSPFAQIARGGRFHPGPEARGPSPLPNVPADLAKGLLPDEVQFLTGRPILQRNVVAEYKRLAPLMDEMKNVTRAGSGLGGWWQRFMDAFDALGAPTQSAQMRAAGPAHAEALKAVHSSLSGNKTVEQANKIAWGVYRDWLEAGRPTDVRAIDQIIKANHGISGGVVPKRLRVEGGKVANLDTQKFWQLVNSPEFQGKVPFHGNAFVGSPVQGLSEGSQKLPSMVATTAGEGNLKRVVFDTHMRDLFGLNGLSDAQYIAASMHIREVGAAMGLEAGEAQEQMWGTVLGLKQLLGKGLSPRQAAQAYSKDVLASVGKDYAQVILDMLDRKDPEMMEIMADLKKYGFDPGGPIAREKLQAIVAQGSRRMAGRAQPINRRLLERTARRIASMGSYGP